MSSRNDPVPPRTGWPGRGRIIRPQPARRFLAPTTQAAGLFPFVAGSGAPTAGAPIGRHLLWGEAVCCDPFAWMDAGLTTNTGMFQLGQPGTGKSAFAKRQVVSAVASGVVPVVLGDPKGEYGSLVAALGGRVVRLGAGLDRINPLDAGSLARRLPDLPEAVAEGLRQRVRRYRLTTLLALCTVVRGPRGRAIGNGEEVVLAAIIDRLSTDLRRGGPPPTLPDVLAALRDPAPEVSAAAEARTPADYDAITQELRWTVNVLCEGSLKGLFDRDSTGGLESIGPALAVDISAVANAGDMTLSACMLASWAWGFAAVDGAAALAEAGLARPRRWLMLLDELWRALRGAPGLVDHADALTRLNRSRGIASLMVTHSLSDLEALPSAADVAKARGFVDRAATVVLAGLPPRELESVAAVVPLSGPEQDLVAGWSSADSWHPGALHPGRGHFLLKTGHRPGIPVAMALTADERRLYDTEAWRAQVS